MTVAAAMSNASNLPKVTVKVLPPPQQPLVLPTPDNPFPKDNPSIFNDAMIVRRRVFIDEQNCEPESELDADDKRSWHFVFYEDDGSVDDTTATTDTSHPQPHPRPPIGVLRIVPPPHTPHTDITSKTFREPQEPYIKLGRFALLREYRGRGLATVLGETGLEWARAHAQEINAALHSDPMAELKATTHTSGRGYNSGTGSADSSAGDQQWRGLSLVHAQKYAEGLYAKKLGFVADKDMGEWIEEGITHIGMWRRLSMH